MNGRRGLARSTLWPVGVLVAVHVVAGIASPWVAWGQTGWAVGGNGGIFKSTDGGASWSGTFPVSALVTSVYFIHPDTGWVAGGQVILKTTDGGSNWTDKYSGGGALNSVFFLNSALGWAVGNAGVVSKSTNGGETWADATPTAAILNSVYFIHPDTGWVAGGQVILKTTNGSAASPTWIDKYTGGGVFNSVFFVNSARGWAVGNTGVVARSTDRGETWSETFPVSATLNSVFFIHPDTGWVAGGQVILKTTNGTAASPTWTDKYTGGADIQSVYFVNSRQGWAVGSNGTILKSTDAGETWVEQTHPTAATLEAVVFPRVRVTVGTAPVGRTFTINGTSYSTAQTLRWPPGSSLTIGTTSPQAGGTGTQYVWLSWSDGGAISHAIAPTSSTTYTSHFTTQHYLTMNAGAGGTVSPASGYRDAGGAVSISATPNVGFAFTGWVGSGAGSYTGAANPASVTMNAPIAETASFAPTVTVSVQTNPTGRSFSVDGATYSTPQTFTWLSGSAHTVATTSPQSGAANTRYVWTSWSDGGAMSHVISPTAGATYTADFNTQYNLTMSASAGGTVSPATGYQDAGASVAISATPSTGVTFTGWTGNGSGSYTGSANPASVTMNAPITETANFVANTAVTVQTVPGGLGFSVDGVPYSSAQGFDWVAGSPHTLATTSPQAFGPDTQFVWTKWSDGGLISHGITTPASPTTYTAHFVPQYFLTLTAGSGGTVTPVSTWQDSGMVVEIRARPQSNYVFMGWTGIGSGSYTGLDTVASVTMTGAVSQTAAFSQNTGVDDAPVVPERLALMVTSANPLRSSVRFRIDIPHKGHVVLRVFDVSGRSTATLLHETRSPGRYEVTWRVRSDNRGSLPAGVYLAELRLDNERRTTRLVLLP